MDRTEFLVNILKGFSPWELESILKVNPNIAFSAWQAWQAFSPEETGSAAALAYDGIAYRHLGAGDFSLEDFHFASEHLRILSALYGMLRPEDAIQPYRLELLSALKVDGKNLYAFWGDTIYRLLWGQRRPVINLCSKEYARLITPYLQPEDVFLTCHFLTRKQGKLRCVTTSAKAARGEMARYIIKHRLTDPADLRQFSSEDYEYVEALSDSTQLTWVREQ